MNIVSHVRTIYRVDPLMESINVVDINLPSALLAAISNGGTVIIRIQKRTENMNGDKRTTESICMYWDKLILIFLKIFVIMENFKIVIFIILTFKNFICFKFHSKIMIEKKNK